MSHWTTFKQTATKLWVTLRHDILALAVFLNGLLIFKTIYGMSVNLLDIFHIKAFSELDLSLLANAPLFMLGVFLVLNSIGLLFRAKLAWAISIILLLIALIYTLHFYPWLKFSIGPRFYVSTSKSIIKALINMHSFEIQLSPIG